MENIGIHEFIWTNTNREISGQGYYIGAELQHNSVLTFYLVIPSKNICEIIKSYLIPNTLFPNENLPKYPINENWFNYTSTKSYLIPNTLFQNENLPKYPINENWFNYTSTPDKDRISVFPPNKFSSMEVHTRQFVIDAGAITKVKFLEITVPKVFEYNENSIND